MGPWADVVEEVGMKFDASRLASSVITGIGFLGAGIIMKVAHQQNVVALALQYFRVPSLPDLLDRGIRGMIPF